jgi:hypothetical protein
VDRSQLAVFIVFSLTRDREGILNDEVDFFAVHGQGLNAQEAVV